MLVISANRDVIPMTFALSTNARRDLLKIFFQPFLSARSVAFACQEIGRCDMRVCDSYDNTVYDLEQFRSPLVRRALYLTNDHDDALDLVQDTFERALRSSAQILQGRDDGGQRWLETTLKNLFIDRWRQKRSRPALLPVTDEHAVAAKDDEPPPWVDMTEPDVLAAVSDLPEPLRSIFQLHHLGGVDYVELGRRFQMPLSTVGTRLHRARRRLRMLLLIRASKDPPERG